MDKKSKLISGIKYQHNGVTRHFFTENEKHHILQDYLSSGETKTEIWKKYTGRREEHGNLLRWMRQLGYDEVVSTRKLTLAPNTVDMHKKNSDKKCSESFENLQLKKRIEELEKQLKDAEMKAVAYSTMIDIAEKELKTSIRKKYNTKPSKK